MKYQLTQGRDYADRLKCQVPGCKVFIRGITGLDEIMKLRKHLNRAHIAEVGCVDALELRAKWEGFSGEWSTKALQTQATAAPESP